MFQADSLHGFPGTFQIFLGVFNRYIGERGMIGKMKFVRCIFYGDITRSIKERDRRFSLLVVSRLVESATIFDEYRAYQKVCRHAARIGSPGLVIY